MGDLEILLALYCWPCSELCCTSLPLAPPWNVPSNTGSRWGHQRGAALKVEWSQRGSSVCLHDTACLVMSYCSLAAGGLGSPQNGDNSTVQVWPALLCDYLVLASAFPIQLFSWFSQPRRRLWRYFNLGTSWGRGPGPWQRLHVAGTQSIPGQGNPLDSWVAWGQH
jgi:hypothetical protein